ncbi:ABC transporter permease [Planococcus sp. CP5-4]|uniref:FtsX-like permease family protein n=2 Tax=Planococcus TaxID=1372 RepID=UPI001C241D06|nr:MULTISPECIES: ABC transporter permease [unclassified Planococcus (in: firmicutes)]MBU9673350.1 ABC transporter permease [Planococcus sp. CP5-4_YE]MBV0908123.1 ABC transporter permease [Planococcus sp. CP5-4_UN]MBW6062184.1 ABC transporter permease [Planococcus sp. CP5-4]
MKSLNQLAFRLFRENKFLVFTSVMSIAIAVSLVLTMALFTVNAKQTLQDDLRKMYGDMDMALVYSDNNPVEDEQELVQLISDHPSTVAVSQALVTQTYVEPLGGDVYTLGIENDPIAKSRYKTSVDLTEDTVAITENLAGSLKLSVGDQIEIENDSFEISEILKNAEGTGIAPDMVIFALERAKLFHKDAAPFLKNETTALMVKTAEETDLTAMANEVKKIQPELRVDIIEEDETAKNNLNSLTLFIGILSMLVLIVTAIMVISNFDLFIYKNKNQFAIMRALGAKTEQLSNIIRIQSTMITAAGALLGLAIAYAADQFLQPILGKWFSVALTQMPFAWEVAIPVLAIASLVIQLFLYIPVLKSSKILPLRMLQENEELDFKHTGMRKTAIKFLWISSLVSLLFGVILAVEENARAILILVGGFLLLASLFLVLPMWLTKLLNVLIPVSGKLPSRNLLIALQNLKPHVKKNSFVILSISVVMIIAVFGSVMLSTVKQNNTDYINEQFPTSLVITSRIHQSEINPVKLSEEVRTEVQGAQVATVSTFGGAELLVDDGTMSFDYTLGDLKALESANIIPEIGKEDLASAAIISPLFAEKHNLQVGDSLKLGIYSDEKQGAEYVVTMVVSAVSDAIDDGEVLFDWQAKALNTSSTNFDKAYVNTYDESAAIDSLETLASMYPELMVNTHAASIEEASDMFVQRWAIFILVLIILIVSVMAGVLNTLVNNILSKRKEFAVLRTIGVRPIGIVKIIVSQISFYLLIGLVFGALCGLVFSVIVSLIDSGSIAIDFSLMMWVAASMWGGSLLIFVPVGWAIGNKKISMEILSDNK